MAEVGLGRLAVMLDGTDASALRNPDHQRYKQSSG